MESDQLGVLIQMLESISLVQNKEDSLIWTFNPNKEFAVNPFSLQVQRCCAGLD